MAEFFPLKKVENKNTVEKKQVNKIMKYKLKLILEKKILNGVSWCSNSKLSGFGTLVNHYTSFCGLIRLDVDLQSL